MKTVITIMLTLFAVTQVQARTPIQPDADFYAKILSVKTDKAFPVAHGEVSFVQKCGMLNPRVELSEPFFNNRVGGEAVVKIRIKVDYRRAKCIVAETKGTLKFEVKSFRRSPTKLVASNDFEKSPFDDETVQLEQVQLDARLEKVLLDPRFNIELEKAKHLVEDGFHLIIIGVTSEKLNDHQQILRIELKQHKITGFASGVTDDLGVIEVDLALPMDTGYIVRRIELVL